MRPMPAKLPDSKRRAYRIITLVTKSEHKDIAGRAAEFGISIGEYTRRKLNDEPLPEKRRR